MVGRTSYPSQIRMHVLALATSLVIILKYGVVWGVLIRLARLGVTVYLWLYTITLERLAGKHTFQIIEAIKFTFSLFLFREAMFFFGIFWAFFDAALSPRIEIGGEWVPIGIAPVRPYGIPLFNTVVLLRRRVTLTWAHRCLMSKENAAPGCTLTLGLGVCFLAAQYVEYKTSSFSISDGIYGRVFYFATGFHGLHVLFGWVFVAVATYLYCNGYLSSVHCHRFDCATVYWHFVDVIWLFLYVFVYWWGY